jgi:iron complex transport system ATP-binding protein
MMPLLETKNVHFSYGQNTVLRGVSLAVRHGSVTGILGPNGAGKSTLIRILAGTLAPSQGEVMLDGRPIDQISYRERAKLVAIVPQETHFPFPFSALEVVLMGRAPYLPRYGFESTHDIEVARAALATTDCAHLANRNILSLSGGERRRVVIARALAQEPRVLLLDEPMSFLDIRHAIDLARLLRKLAREQGLAVAAVVHDLNLAAGFCDQLVMLKEGRVAAEGTPSELMTPAIIREIYGIGVTTGTNPHSGVPYCLPCGPISRPI